MQCFTCAISIPLLLYISHFVSSGTGPAHHCTRKRGRAVQIMAAFVCLWIWVKSVMILYIECIQRRTNYPRALGFAPSMGPLLPLFWSPYGIGQTIMFLSCFFLLMVALCNRADHYIFILFLSFFFLLLSSFFPRLISAVREWMFTILWHMVWL